MLKMKRLTFLFLFIVNSFTLIASQNYFEFSALPILTPDSVFLGLNGAYAGIDDDVLIISGGSDFNDTTGVYSDRIFLLKKNEKTSYSWTKMPERIPSASAYGGAVPTPFGLLCFGGTNGDQCISESWFINYIPEDGKIDIRPGPALPVPLSNFTFAKVDNNLFIAGGISEENGPSGNFFFSLDMTENDAELWKWKILPAWDGQSLAFAVGVAQSDGETNCFYLFPGKNMDNNGKTGLLSDAHVYNPFLKKWTAIAWADSLMGGTAFPVGASTIVFINGEDGELTGFNTITKESYKIDQIPITGQVTSGVRWSNDYVFPAGKPGEGTELFKINIKEDIRHLKFWDIVVIVLYFLVLAWMGYFFSKRQKNTHDYFKGGGRIPWWAAGLSIFGTAVSAITFMAIPAKTFATNWTYLMLNMTIFLVAPIIILLFIPFYRKLNVTTAYEFLENRFNLTVRLLGSISFIVYQIGRIGVVLFLPSIALNVVTGIDIFVCIGLMGIVSLVYTMMGGIEAVIWTDVMQVFVLMGGALLSLVLITLNIEGGFSTIVQVATENHKLRMFDLSLSMKEPTVWVMLLGGMFANITTYGTDQTMVQRYMTTSTRKAANRSVWTNAILTIPATFIFFFVGTALFAFYKAFPAELNPTFQNNDAIFPWYIASKLPEGIAGLLIAGIFAAAMSSLSSSMNSGATAYSTDIHFRFGWSKNINQLKLARMATLVIGIIGTLFAFMMATMDIKSLWDEFQKVLGLIIGSLGGIFLLGILSKRANSAGALIGIAISILVQILVAIYEPVHLMVYSATGVVSCFVAGWIASWFFKAPKRDHSD